MTEKLWPLLHRVARVASPAQWLSRGIVVVAAIGTVVAGGAAGAPIHWLLVVLVGGSALATAVQPDSHAGAVTLFLLVMFWWWTVPPESASGSMVLVASAAMVALHVAATLAAYGPSTLVIEPDLVRLWVRRGALLWGATFAAWAAARLASPGGVSLVLALVVLTGVAWWAAVRLGPGSVPGEG